MLSDWTPQACRGQRRVAFTARHPCWPTWRWHIRASWRRDSCSLPVRLTCFNLCAACLKDDLHREIALGTIWTHPILDLSPSESPTRSHLSLHFLCGSVASRCRPHHATSRSLVSFRLDTLDCDRNEITIATLCPIHLPRPIIPPRIHPTFPSPLHGPSPPKGNDYTTQLHVALARLDPASRATLLMAMLFLQSLFTTIHLDETTHIVEYFARSPRF